MEKRIIFFWIAGFFLPAINATVFNLPNLIYLYAVVKGLPCNMTVPWNCRNVPTTHVEALPLTADGKCKAVPKISDVPKICTNNQWVNINMH